MTPADFTGPSVRDSVRDSVERSVGGSVEYSVRRFVWRFMSRSVWGPVDRFVGHSVEDSLLSQLREPL
jgi:hypothetical protein